ncbi:MAG: SoxR reducing system RseC family protein [Alistipes sp.]|nr:SoxR reducing system RseC family protein [Alistipes sp.]
MDSAEIKHRGEVIRIEGSTVYVRMKVQSACSACHARAVCGAGESADKIVEVDTPSAAAYRAGEEVEVALQRKGMGAESVLLAYVAPFFVLMALLVALVAAGAGEGVAALSAIGGVLLYYGVLYLLRDKIRKEIKFTITKQTK